MIVNISISKILNFLFPSLPERLLELQCHLLNYIRIFGSLLNLERVIFFEIVHGHEMYQRIYKHRKILASLSGLERPKQNYSLQYRRIFKETGTEKKEKHQKEVTV